MVQKLNIKIDNALHYVGRDEVDTLLPELVAAKGHLLKGDAAGNDFLGWVNLPEEIDADMLARLKADMARLAGKSRLMVVIGIGGSYLGGGGCSFGGSTSGASGVSGESESRLGGSGIGTAEISEWVYGCSGKSNSSSVGAISTMLPL